MAAYRSDGVSDIAINDEPTDEEVQTAIARLVVSDLPFVVALRPETALVDATAVVLGKGSALPDDQDLWRDARPGLRMPDGFGHNVEVTLTAVRWSERHPKTDALPVIVLGDVAFSVRTNLVPSSRPVVSIDWLSRWFGAIHEIGRWPLRVAGPVLCGPRLVRLNEVWEMFDIEVDEADLDG